MPLRCVYKENGARCIRNGIGNPPLCRPHGIVMRDAAKKTSSVQSPGRFEAAASIVDDLLSGRRISRNKVASALDEFAWAMGGGYTDYHPDIDIGDDGEDDEGPDVDPEDLKYDDDPEPAPRRGPSWFREEPPPPPPPPPVEERRRAQLEARQVLGFSPSDQLSEDVLRRRLRELAKKHHPDRGGSTERMQAINAAHDVLVAAL